MKNKKILVKIVTIVSVIYLLNINNKPHELPDDNIYELNNRKEQIIII